MVRSWVCVLVMSYNLGFEKTKMLENYRADHISNSNNLVSYYFTENSTVFNHNLGTGLNASSISAQLTKLVL